MIPKSVEYEWKIKGNGLNELKSYNESGRFMFCPGIDSESFGNNKWNLNLFYIDKLLISPRLLMVPYGVYAIRVSMVVSNDINKHVIKDVCQFMLDSRIC